MKIYSFARISTGLYKLLFSCSQCSSLYPFCRLDIHLIIFSFCKQFSDQIPRYCKPVWLNFWDDLTFFFLLYWLMWSCDTRWWFNFCMGGLLLSCVTCINNPYCHSSTPLFVWLLLLESQVCCAISPFLLYIVAEVVDNFIYSDPD